MRSFIKAPMTLTIAVREKVEPNVAGNGISVGSPQTWAVVILMLTG